MNPFDRKQPSRPWIDKLGVAIELDIDTRRRKIVVTKQALDAALGMPPANVKVTTRDRMWLAVVQHNVDVIAAAAARRLAHSNQADDPIFLGPEDIAGWQ